jgi:anti-sigma B factor antagonist
MSTASSDKTWARLCFEGEMTIQAAAAQKARLLAALEGATRLDIDLSKVTELDSAGVQLLLLAKRCADLQQAELRLLDHSPAVVDLFQLLNLAAFFGDPLFLTPTNGTLQ